MKLQGVISSRDQEELSSLRHFWETKGDITRMHGYKELLAKHPDIDRAWNTYKDAEDNLTRLLKHKTSEQEF